MRNRQIWLQKAKAFIFYAISQYGLYFWSQMPIYWPLLSIQLVIYSLLLEIVKFELSLVGKILIFQLVNSDIFLSKMTK